MEPPPRGWGWQTRAATGAWGRPSFSTASSFPEGPARSTLLRRPEGMLRTVCIVATPACGEGLDVVVVMPLHILRRSREISMGEQLRPGPFDGNYLDSFKLAR